MRKLPSTGALLLALLAGCADLTPTASKTPHNGTLVTLPEDKGFVEVAKQADPDKEGQVQVVIYFLGPNRQAMGSPPTAARLKLGGKSTPPVDLGAGPDGSLITPPLPDVGEVTGTLTATIEGKEVSVPIAIR